jgi:methionine--tRNA ligase beta chain
MIGDLMVSFNEWQNVDLRVGKILKVEEIEGKDKIYKLQVNFGEEDRQIIAGIKPYYSIEELEGKKVVFVYNMDPATIAGEESQGMILGVPNEENRYKLLFADDSVREGTRVE